MSYNCDSIEYISGKLSIKRSVAVEALQKHADELPESDFISEAVSSSDGLEPDSIIEIENPWWGGEGSGRSYVLFKELLSLTTGAADLLLTWEGGDSINGLRVSEGNVHEKKVKHTLVDE